MMMRVREAPDDRGKGPAKGPRRVPPAPAQLPIARQHGASELELRDIAAKAWADDFWADINREVKLATDQRPTEELSEAESHVLAKLVDGPNYARLHKDLNTNLLREAIRRELKRASRKSRRLAASAEQHAQRAYERLGVQVVEGCCPCGCVSPLIGPQQQGVPQHVCWCQATQPGPPAAPAPVPPPAPAPSPAPAPPEAPAPEPAMAAGVEQEFSGPDGELEVDYG